MDFKETQFWLNTHKPTKGPSLAEFKPSLILFIHPYEMPTLISQLPQFIVPLQK